VKKTNGAVDKNKLTGLQACVLAILIVLILKVHLPLLYDTIEEVL